MRSRREQLLDPRDAGTGLLEVPDLGLQLADGLAEQDDVAVDQEDGADADGPAPQEGVAQSEGHRLGGGEEAERHHPHHLLGQDGPQREGQPLPQAGHEAALDVGHGAVGAQVFGAGELLDQEAVEQRLRLLHGGPDRSGPGVEAQHGQQHGEGEGPGGETDDQALPGQQHQHADQQEGVADDVDDEAGEEGGQDGDVAVYPFDQLARGARAVKGGVEAQAVQGDVGPQGVRRRPGDALGEVVVGDGDDLGDDGDGDEQQGDGDERALRAAAEGGVDEGPLDLGAGETAGRWSPPTGAPAGRPGATGAAGSGKAGASSGSAAGSWRVSSSER